MADKNLPEFWLSGPVDNIPTLLQPIAHALLQANREIHEALANFDETLLWQKVAGMASVGFHLQHIAGVLSRLYTYAISSQLTNTQLEYLKKEGVEEPQMTTKILLANLEKQVATSLDFLKTTNTAALTETRFVGRKLIPSTLMGLLVHSAEHTMRHTGQLLVTAKVLMHQ